MGLSSPSHVVPKLLTENQVLSEPTHSRSELTTEESLDYINVYINGYGRPWTSSDLDPRMWPSLDKLQVVARHRLGLRITWLIDSARDHG
jgi:hypothetical protein